jgi:hypothetical protein
MTDNYKATPECWEWQEKWASKEVPDEDSSCFLELRARVEALEAQAPVAGGLVARVAYAITAESGDSDGPINWSPEARAAIFEVARWLREQGTPASGWAMRLEQEAGR